MTNKAQKNMTMQETLTLLENVKNQWVTAVDALVDPLMFVGSDYKIKKANMALAEIANIDVKSIPGKTCYKLFANRSEPCPGCKMLQAIATGTVQHSESDSIIQENFYEVTSQPTRDTDGKVDGCVQVYHDRTVSKRLEKQLIMQEKLASIGLLAGGVAHEINNPLGGILIFSQMVLKEMDKDSAHYQDLVEIEAATQRCKGIVDSLLNFARQQPNRKSQKNEPINLIEAIKSAINFAEVGQKSRRSKVEITSNIEFTEILVNGDKNKFVQVFLNVIQNAIQSLKKEGTVEIDVALNKTQIITRITDNGQGIAPKNISKIFDPFFTTKDPGEGTGLGLALCYSIIHEAGGSMDVKSALKKGSTFTIELPIAT